MAKDVGYSESSAAVTPHDSNAIPGTPRGLFVGTGGNIVGRLKGDVADQTWKNIGNGSFLPFCFKYIKTTSTAADMIVHY